MSTKITVDRAGRVVLAETGARQDAIDAWKHARTGVRRRTDHAAGGATASGIAQRVWHMGISRGFHGRVYP